MGLCNSKRSVKKHPKRFNPVASKSSQKSYASTRPILSGDNSSHTYNNQPTNKSNNSKGNNKNNQNDQPNYNFNNYSNFDIYNDYDNEDFVIYEEDQYCMDIHKLEHALLQNTWRNPFSNPIEEDLLKGQSDVLDVACGPGYWICDVATKFSNSQFIGIQAFPIQKKQNFPHNANFLRIDILNGLPYDADSFHFVHLRILSPKYTEEQWKSIITHMTRVTKPGGYCEIEVGDYLTFENEGPLLKETNANHRRCLEESGIKVNITSELENVMKGTNEFSSISKESRKIPMGRSAGKYGEMASKHFIQTLNSQKENMSSYLGQTFKDFDDNIVKIISELDNYKSTCYNCIRVFGRKIEKVEEIEKVEKIENTENVETIENIEKME